MEKGIGFEESQNKLRNWVTGLEPRVFMVTVIHALTLFQLLPNTFSSFDLPPAFLDEDLVGQGSILILLSYPLWIETACLFVLFVSLCYLSLLESRDDKYFKKYISLMPWKLHGMIAKTYQTDSAGSLHGNLLLYLILLRAISHLYLFPKELHLLVYNSLNQVDSHEWCHVFLISKTNHNISCEGVEYNFIVYNCKLRTTL